MTAKKKTLIELMLDAGVTPEKLNGVYNFIAQDYDGWFVSYENKPYFSKEGNQFFCDGSHKAIHKHNELCENWRCAIITKQQFIDAYNERNSQKDNAVVSSAYDACTDKEQPTGISLSFEDAERLANNYASLSNVLRRAYDQAASGKGHERHAQELPFNKQPMQQIQDLVGEGFALGQAIKKMQESQRLQHDAAIRELLGAINYIAGVIIHKEKQGRK